MGEKLGRSVVYKKIFSMLRVNNHRKSNIYSVFFFYILLNSGFIEYCALRGSPCAEGSKNKLKGPLFESHSKSVLRM